jgi:hypothetical protein
MTHVQPLTVKPLRLSSKFAQVAATKELFSCLIVSPPNTNNLAVSQYELNIRTTWTQKGLSWITKNRQSGKSGNFNPRDPLSYP